MPPTPETATCSNCRFFENAGQNTTLGFCHVKPPEIGLNPEARYPTPEGQFPGVWEHWWCREFQSNKPSYPNCSDIDPAFSRLKEIKQP